MNSEIEKVKGTVPMNQLDDVTRLVKVLDQQTRGSFSEISCLNIEYHVIEPDQKALIFFGTRAQMKSKYP